MLYCCRLPDTDVQHKRELHDQQQAASFGRKHKDLKRNSKAISYNSVSETENELEIFGRQNQTGRIG